MKIDEEIELAIEEAKSKGWNGPYKVAPASDIRCFVPCGIGSCVCYRAISNKYCLVSEEGYKRAISQMADEVIFVQDRVDKIASGA